MASSSSSASPLPPDADLLPDISHPMQCETLDKIDAEMARLEYQLHSLRQLHNVRVPISRFPPEILSNVFLLCHQQDTGPRNSRLILSWVSRYWRNVALGYPTLWSAIRIIMPRRRPSLTLSYIKKCFIRSKNTALTIEYDDSRPNILALLSTQIHRIRKLSIITHDNDNDDLLVPLPDAWQASPASYLVDLELDGISLVGSSFGQVCPLLQSLIVRQCIGIWDSPLMTLSTLTTLKIYEPRDIMTPRELIPKLQALSSLRSCTLHGCLDSFDDPSLEGQVRLPLLEDVSVMDEDTEIMLIFLRGIDLSSAYFEAIYEDDELQEEMFLQILDMFREFHDDPEYEPWKDIRRLAFRRHSMTGVLDSFTITFHSGPNRRFTCGFAARTDKIQFDPVLRCLDWIHGQEIHHSLRAIQLDTVSVEGLESFGPFLLLETLEIETVEGDFFNWAVSSSKMFYPSVKEVTVGGALYAGFGDYIAKQGRAEGLVELPGLGARGQED